MHRASTIQIAERVGRVGVGALLVLGVALGAGIVPTETPLWADLLLAVASAALIGSATWVGGALRLASTLPLQIAPVASRGTSGGQPVYRFRAQLGRGRSLTEPVATVSWQPVGGSEVALEPWLPADTLCGPFTLIARDPQQRVDGDGAFVVRLQVRSGGRDWSAEQRIAIDRVGEGTFGGVEVNRRGVRFTDDWQQIE